MATTSTASPDPPGKKAVDFQLNMIPMIDLLSVIISFLLLTAALNPVSKIGVRPSPDEGVAPSESPRPQDGADGEKLSVIIRGSGYIVAATSGVIREIDKHGEDYDAATLSSVLAQFHSDHPSEQDVEITSDDNVPYRELIRVMDLCLAHKLDGIAVSGSAI